MLTDQQILDAMPHALLKVDLPGWPGRVEGKVRDSFVQGEQRVLVTTDRVSAFDRVLGAIPYKGQVLNELSAWWFDQIRDLVPSHLLATPDPNVTVAHEAEALPVEVIVRGYITGVTSTALWTLYSQGVDRPYGLELPAGLRKNDALPRPVITPTTKGEAGAHDERLTSDEVVQKGLVQPELWAQVCAAALAVFARGQQVAANAGLILVDTKYEFGLIDGELAIIDEVHTPDSSRYWVAETYQAALDAGRDPDQYDKELLRQWFVDRGYRGEGQAPQMTPEFVVQLSQRYVSAFEKLTGRTFEPAAQPAAPRIQAALARHFDHKE